MTGRFPLAMAAETLLIYEISFWASSVEDLGLLPSWTQFPTVNREPQSGRKHLLISIEGECYQFVGLLVRVSSTSR